MMSNFPGFGDSPEGRGLCLGGTISGWLGPGFRRDSELPAGFMFSVSVPLYGLQK
jgi:hypothetical protein